MSRAIIILLLCCSTTLSAQQKTVNLKLRLQPTYSGVIGNVPLTVILDINNGTLKGKCTPGKVTDIEGVMLFGKKYSVQELGGLECISEIDWGMSLSMYVGVLVDGKKIQKKGSLYPHKTTTEYLEIVTIFDLFNNSVYTFKEEEKAKFRKMLIEKFNAGAIQLADPEIRQAQWSSTCFDAVRKALKM